MAFPRDQLIVPEQNQWQFPEEHEMPTDDDLVAVGADLEPGTVLGAYSAGCFPMPINRRQIGWFCPEPRGILHPAKLRTTRSLRQSAKRYRVTVNQAFDEVLSACADPARPMGWIDHRITKAYTALNRMGWAHSVEVWDEDGLAGGLYGLSIGPLFAGESMFHRRRDASKVALVHLVDLVSEEPDALIDVQWLTPHLESLGAEACSRANYLAYVRRALGDGSLPLGTGGLD